MKAPVRAVRDQLRVPYLFVPITELIDADPGSAEARKHRIRDSAFRDHAGGLRAQAALR